MMTGVVELVGRDVELATLAELAGIDAPPHAGTVLVSGDAGIGKSRLLQAVADRAVAAGWRVGWGHCLDLGGSPVPYLPFAELIGQLVADPDEAGRLAERWPAAAGLLGRESGSLAAVDRGRMFEAVHGVLTDLGRQAPLLVVIEDLHWADQSSLDLLSSLFARWSSAPVSIIGSYRSDDLHRRHPLRPVVAGWSRLPGMGRVELGPLPEPDVRRLVAALRSAPISEADLRTVVDRAEGNAFFVEELTDVLGSDGLPGDLTDVLLLRADELGDEARTVVRAAAVGGRLVDERLLAAVCDLPAERLEAALRAAVEFHLLVPDTAGYRFRHSLLTEAIDDDLLPGERVRLNAAYVAALQRLDPDVRRPAALARHALAAHDVTVAARAGVRAGDQARAIGGPDEALRHYAQALDLIDREGIDPATAGTDLITLTERTALAAIAAGRVRRAYELYRHRLDRLPAGTAQADRARLLVGLVETSYLTELDFDELGLTAEAAALVPADPPTPLRSRIVAARAVALSGDGQGEEALRWVEEGLGMPPETRTGEVTAQLQTTLARLSERGGDTASSTKILHELVDRTHTDGDPAEVRALHQLGALLLEQGELTEALATYRRSAERSAALGQPYAPYGVDSRVLAGLVAFQIGDWATAAEMAELEDSEVPPLARAGLLAVQLALRAGTGHHDGWGGVFDVIRAEWRHDGMLTVQSAIAAIDLAGDTGDVAAAVRIHDDAVSQVTTLWRTPDFQARIRLAAVLLGQLATAAVRADPADRAVWAARGEALADQVRDATDMGRRRERGIESRAWLARLEAERLRLHWLAGDPVDPDASVAAWRAAVDGFERYGNVPERARSQARLAAALRAAGKSAEARTVAERAHATAEELGAAPLQAELRASTGPQVEVLTAREAEVLLLVGEGLSNREVGERLFISAKTASVHVSNILAKLDARNRTEAVAVARRRGLIGV